MDEESKRLIFPYKIFWEELGSEWEEYVFSKTDLENARMYFGALKAMRAPADLIITEQQLSAIITPLDLDAVRATLLRYQLLALAGRHLNPQHRKFLRQDIAATQKKMTQLAQAIDALEAATNALAPPLVALLQFVRGVGSSSEHPTHHMTLRQLVHELQPTADAARDIVEDTKRRKGRPRDTLRRRTLRAAGRAIEQASQKDIETTWTEKTHKTFKFRGVEGQTLRAFFKLVDPTYGERPMVEDWRKEPPEHASHG